MTALDDAALDARARLLKLEDRAALSIVRTYKGVYARMTARLDQLTAQIDEARRQGHDVKVSWLYRQERYLSLIDQLERDLVATLAEAARAVETGQAAAVELAAEEAPWLARIAAGGAPAEALNVIDDAFKALPSAPLASVVGFAADNRPLGLLFAEIAPDGVQGVRNALAEGVAAGFGPRETARHVRKAAGIPLTRSLTIARSETMRAYREASRDRFIRSGVVGEWVWHAQLDNRTCPLCWAMHGTTHGVDETLDTHANCRCAPVGRTLSWEELGFEGIPDDRPTIETGESLFEKLKPADQRQILGPGKHDLYVNGDLVLGDVVRETQHPRWGAGRRVATLRELEAPRLVA